MKIPAQYIYAGEAGFSLRIYSHEILVFLDKNTEK